MSKPKSTTVGYVVYGDIANTPASYSKKSGFDWYDDPPKIFKTAKEASALIAAETKKRGAGWIGPVSVRKAIDQTITVVERRYERVK